MGAVHIRNLWCSNETGTNSTLMERVFLWLIREAFLVGRWTVADIDSDTAWDSAANILLPLSDYSVTAANPYRVTSATGGFDAATHEGRMITLFASNDNIRGIYNIENVVDSNTLYLDARTRAGAWPSDESGITGRIHKAAIGEALDSTSSYVVMQAPAASGSNLQVKFNHNSADAIYLTGYPLGDWLTAATPTATVNNNTNVYDDYMRMNWYFSDQSALPLVYQYFYTGTSGNYWDLFTMGELTDTVTGDNNPGFVHAYWDYLSNNSYMRMLNEIGAQANFYPAYYKAYSNTDDSDCREKESNAVRINGGRHKVFRPVIVGEDTTQGGFIRGIDPRTYTHSYVASIDEFGTDWWHFGSCCLVPRDGVDDPRPLTLATWR